MKAAVLTKPRTFEIRDLPIPEPDQNEVRIRLEGCGVCASNIPLWEGRKWFNYPADPGEPGHEGWGIVDAIGNGVESFKAGDRVCCLSYHAYAAYDLAKESHVLKIPDQLIHMPFPGEPLGCAMNIFDRSDIRSGQTVAIVGMGFLGLLLLQLCNQAGAKTIALSRREYALNVARQNGANHTIKLDDHLNIINEASELTGGNFCDRTIEATGKEWPLNVAVELTKVRGKLIVAGFHQDGLRQVNMQLLNWRGIDMINAHQRDPLEYVNGMKKAIKAVSEGLIAPEKLYTHEFRLENLDHAFDLMVTRPDGFIKALIRF